MNLTETVAFKLKNAILNGEYGKSGERFISIRELAIKENISYSLSHKIFHLLEKEHLLFLVKQIWYVTYGVASKNSPLRQISSDLTIGLHIKEINNPYIGSIVADIKELLKKNHIRLIIQTSENNSEDECAILKYFVKLGCIGVIDFPSSTGNLSNFYRLYPLPLIFIGRMVNVTETEYMPCVLSDNYGISKAIARKFISQNYKNFYYIGTATLPDDNNERLKGFRDGVNESFTFFSENLCKLDYKDDNAFKKFCEDIVKKSSRESPTLLFCVNDLYASKIVSNLMAYHADIPASVSIIGYDNLPVCRYSTPTISSIAYSFSAIAEQSVNLLLSIHTKNTQKNQKIVINNFLIHRDTTIPR